MFTQSSTRDEGEKKQGGRKEKSYILMMLKLLPNIYTRDEDGKSRAEKKVRFVFISFSTCIHKSNNCSRYLHSSFKNYVQKCKHPPPILSTSSSALAFLPQSCFKFEFIFLLSLRTFYHRFYIFCALPTFYGMLQLNSSGRTA